MTSETYFQMSKTYQTIRLVLSLYHNARNAGLQSTVIGDFFFVVATQFLCIFFVLLSCHALFSEHTSTVGDTQDKERIYWEYQIKGELNRNLRYQSWMVLKGSIHFCDVVC